MDEDIKYSMDNIFYDLQKYNFNYDKKILVFTDDKKQEIELNDYIFFFIQTIINQYIFNLNLSTITSKALSLNKCFVSYLSIKKIKNKNVVIDNLTINFKEDDIQFSNDEINFKYAVFNKNTLTGNIYKYCENILDILYRRQNKLYCSFLNLYNNRSFGHSVILLILKNNDKLELFIYDPVGEFSMYYNKIENFLQILKRCFELNNYNYFNSCELFSQKNNDIITINLQSFFEVKKNNGYCSIFSLFFLYCFLVVFEISPVKNFSILRDIQLYFANKYFKTGSEEVYFSVVCFANNIKDIFLFGASKLNVKEEVINKINNNIIYLFKKHSLNKIFIESNYKYILPQPITSTDQLDKRNYDEELNLLDWSTMKELRENEECKENEECISKICRDNKCTRPTPNDKLDFLTRLEWDELD